ncbi:FBD-associated F-box protein At1g66320-like [Apium graveolens]|uniref:FBD-associated F-box protein At1g66320-like n=1 Tax=Apium graveolens TaxID=4045 RepID=UPI003D7957F4
MESREKRSKQEIDISNFLPEAVFSNIISWLPVKEAVRTSVLVKSWKYAWKYVMRLDLDPASISEQNVELAKRESQNGKELTPIRRSREYLMRCTELYTSVIQSIKDEVTHSQIVHFSTNINSGELEKWVEELLMRKKVRALSLKCFENAIIGIDYNVEHLGLCAGIFSSLECLELTSYRLLDTSPFQSCERLRTLKLSGLVLGTKLITEIFSFCESLEKLSMLQCQGFSKLEISSGNLNSHILILYKVYCRWSSVVIDAPGVAELQAYCSAEGASQELRESYLTQEKLLERCTGFLSCYERSHPLYSCRMGYVSAFHNLQVLSTSLDLNDIRQAILLSYIFRVCFQLKRLDITVEVRDLCKVGKLCHPEHLFWEKKGISDCIACCLRAVTVQNFRGQVLEIEFVKYLTTRAPRMRRVTVKCADNCTNKEITAIRNLLSFPRSPMNVSVVIEPPSPTAARFSIFLPNLIIFVVYV